MNVLTLTPAHAQHALNAHVHAITLWESMRSNLRAEPPHHRHSPNPRPIPLTPPPPTHLIRRVLQHSQLPGKCCIRVARRQAAVGQSLLHNHGHAEVVRLLKCTPWKSEGRTRVAMGVRLRQVMLAKHASMRTGVGVEGLWA